MTDQPPFIAWPILLGTKPTSFLAGFSVVKNDRGIRVTAIGTDCHEKALAFIDQRHATFVALLLRTAGHPATVLQVPSAYWAQPKMYSDDLEE